MGMEGQKRKPCVVFPFLGECAPCSDYSIFLVIIKQTFPLFELAMGNRRAAAK